MLVTRDDELRKGQQRIEAMINWLGRMYLTHTPEISEERRAAAGGQRRYRNYRKAVAESVEKTESHGGVAFARPDRQGPSAATRLVPRALDGSLATAMG